MAAELFGVEDPSLIGAVGEAASVGTDVAAGEGLGAEGDAAPCGCISPD